MWDCLDTHIPRCGNVVRCLSTWSHGLRYLLEVGQVATVPGDAFGAPDCIRLSYAASMADLEKALDRLATALTKIKNS